MALTEQSESRPLPKASPAGLRICGAALGVGIVGGIATAFLSVSLAASDVSLTTRAFTVGLPLVRSS